MSVILVGKNSRLYKAFQFEFNSLIDHSISHSEIASYKFKKDDVLILLSYSNNLEEQITLLEGIKKAAVSRVIVFSSAAAVVGELHDCYKYPTAKLKIERAIKYYIENYQIIRMGTVVDEGSSRKYRGMCITYIYELRDFLVQELTVGCNTGNRITSLFSYAKFNNERTFEYYLYKKYTTLISALTWPCLLRPADLLLKYIFGYKWYGYGVLSAVLNNVLEIHE